MIKFFRKIRYDLMGKNKTTTYFKYAIGEIVLVVIGILIALWINNTYQDYKNKQLSTLFTQGFKRDLVADITLLVDRIKRNKNVVKSIDSIIVIINYKTELSSDELQSFIRCNTLISYESSFIPEKGTIRQFESQNSNNLMSSKSLKAKLFSYHTLNDRNEKNMETSVQLYQHTFFTRDFVKILLTEEIINEFNGIESAMNPESINNIRNNKEYVSSLFHKKEITKNQNRNYQDVKTKAKELIGLIESELE
jgi:hypothetical protein